MKTITDPISAGILIGVLRDLQTELAKPQPGGYGHAVEKFAWKLAQDGLVRVDPARWLRSENYCGRQRMTISRAYTRLEKDGLLIKAAVWGAKTSHVGLTPAGRELAEQLAAEQEAQGDG